MDSVRLDNVSFAYSAAAVVSDVSFSAAPGEMIALLGPSGCGKSTLLNLIGGYLTPSAGRIHLNGRDVTTLPPEKRNAGMVFQSYALFPHLTVRDNVGFGLDARRTPRGERNRRVEAILDRVDLAAPERERKPAALSGGQQQRVALARALAIEPDVLLLDEPLANLDRSLREQLRAELRALQRQTGVTALLVTHDQEEALAISDRIGVLNAGRILQIGPPGEIYSRPRTAFVARSAGVANLFEGKFVGLECRTAMVRPESCTLNPLADAGRLIWPGRVEQVAFLGADCLIDVACDNGVTLRVRSRAAAIAVGARVTVGIAEEGLWPIPEPDPQEPG